MRARISLSACVRDYLTFDLLLYATSYCDSSVFRYA